MMVRHWVGRTADASAAEKDATTAGTTACSMAAATDSFEVA